MCVRAVSVNVCVCVGGGSRAAGSRTGVYVDEDVRLERVRHVDEQLGLELRVGCAAAVVLVTRVVRALGEVEIEVSVDVDVARVLAHVGALDGLVGRLDAAPAGDV